MAEFFLPLTGALFKYIKNYITNHTTVSLLLLFHHIFMEGEGLCSFLEGVDDSEFSLENVPFGMASRKGEK